MVRSLKRFLFSAAVLLLPALAGQVSGLAQGPADTLLSAPQELCLILASRIPVPDISYVPVAPPRYWTNGMLNQVGFSQLSLTNWAEGGSGTISMNAFVDMHANYARGKMIWENRAQFSYGFIQSFENGYKKGDDKIWLNSKWGYEAVSKLYFSALFTFRTQFSNGFDNGTDAEGNPIKILSSRFMAPGYVSLGLGIDYKPFPSLSVNFAPLTGNLVIVTAEQLRTKYGNKADEAVRREFGAQLKSEFKLERGDWKIQTALTLFSDFLNEPQNIQVYWDVNASYVINKFLTATVRTNLIYDDNILISDRYGRMYPRIQFKEIFSLSFTYTFGNYKKLE